MIKNSFIILFVLLLSACASSPYPMGMSEEQWQKLSPNERQSLLLKQQEYDEQQRLQRQQAQAKQRQLELALQIQEEQRLAQLYASPVAGNVVMMNLLSGEYRYKNRVFQIQPVSLLLARGETKEIRLALRDAKGKRSSERAFVKYNREGTGLYLYLNTPSNYNDDYLAVLRDGRWNCGSDSQHQFAFNQNESLQRLKLFVKDKNAQCRTPYSAPQHGQPYPVGRPIPNRR